MSEPVGLIQQKTELNQRLINRIINISDAYFDEENDDADAERCMEWIDGAITEYYEAKERLERLFPEKRRKPWLTTEADKIKPWRE